jgi:hypothetical protein
MQQQQLEVVAAAVQAHPVWLPVELEAVGHLQTRQVRLQTLERLTQVAAAAADILHRLAKQAARAL